MNRHDPGRIGGHGVAKCQCLGMNGQVLRQLGLGTARKGRGNQCRENLTVVVSLSHEILPFP